MWPDAARRHISQASFQRFTAGLAPDLRIMDLMDSQPEFTKAIWDYLDILVNDNRLAKGREILAKYKPQFDAVEKAYGVDRYIVASIWGIESNYSTMMGDRSVLNSTATLACIGRRQKYFRDEFLVALEILHRGDLRPEQLRGSWAGAFGPTQFMPTAFKRYAVDADGDGRRDVVDNPHDLIASTANNLKKDGWQTGQTWGFEVVMPKNFNYMLADRAKAMTIAQWEHLGLTRAGGKPFPNPADKAYLLAPAGAEGPGFLMLQNFRVIMKYNPAEAYALAIGHFADRLRGGAPFVQPWPRQERSAVAHRAAGTAAAPGPARLLSWHPRRPVRRSHPRGPARLPGLDRGAGGRICLRRRAGTAQGAVKSRFRPAKVTLNQDFSGPTLTAAAEARFMAGNLPACGLIPLL